MIVLSKLLFAAGVVTTIVLSNANKNLRGRQLELEENVRKLQNERNLDNGRTLVRNIILFIYYIIFYT